MVKFVDEQSEVDRLRAVNAELLEACKVAQAYFATCEPVWGHESREGKMLRAAIAKATNQEAGR